MPIPAWLAGGAISLGTSAFGSWSQNRNIDKQLAAQKEENERIRAYNFKLAKQQNEWNIAQWQRENEYNSPSAQKARLQAAGLNADMMYGQGGITNTSMSSPQMTSGAAATPMDWSSLANKATIGDTVTQALNNKLLQAQVDNINADTQKKGAETSILSDDASFRKAYNQGQLDTMYAQINLQGSQQKLNDKQIMKIQHEIQQIDSYTQQLQVGIEKIHNDIANDNARLDFQKLLNDAQVKQAYESASLTREQANRLVNEWEYMLRNYDDMHEVNLGQGAKLRQEGQNLKFHADMTYGGRDKEAIPYLQTLKFLNQLTTFALPFIKK